MPLEAHFPSYSEALWSYNPAEGDRASRNMFPLMLCTKTMVTESSTGQPRPPESNSRHTM